LAERLLDRGERVVALRRDREPDSRFVTAGLERRCIDAPANLTDHASVLRVLNEHDVGTVFHLAAQTIVATANRSPLSTWESNVRGTYVLLEACRAHQGAGGRIERIVVASSDKAYGEHDELPYSEDFPLRARYPYDVSKACADMIARSYALTYDLPVGLTRLANVYGPGDLNWSRLIPDTARALIRGERPVIRSDGTPVRDYLYVEDAVNAYFSVAASLDRPEMRGRAWNAARGAPIGVLDLVRRLIEVSGRHVEPLILGEGIPHGEIARQEVDSTAIREELGWDPRWDLARGLADTWQWYEQRLGS
jgi:CDP-glucose 4,6-dehydratase